MARKEKLNVDYFPHLPSKGKKMRYIKKKFPLGVGYSTWYIVLENLAEANYHYLDIRDEIQLMFLASECDLSEDEFIEVISEIAKIGGFDQEMLGLGILWSIQFTDSVQEAWKRRNEDCLYKNEIIKLLDLKQTIKAPNTQTPIKEDKKQPKEVKEAKTDIIYPWETESFKKHWEIWKDYKRKEWSFGFKSEISEQASMMQLSKLAKGEEEIALKIIMKSLEQGWKGFFELKNESNGKQIASNNKKPTVSSDYLQGVLNDLQS